jgi:radical SAM superfamily enzyme YgiQ (UPF0313 family)
MNILLVLPAADHLRVTAENPRVPDRAVLRFSILPLTTVAALTPPGHNVRICDENVQPVDFDADVDLVGLSFMTALAPRAYEIAREFRKRGKLVVGGGFHPTLCPQEAVQHLDAICVGDAEGAWPAMIRDAENGSLRKVYRAEPSCQLTATPPPRRELMRDTARHYVTTNAVQTGRGCRHACRYCSVSAFHGHVHRSRPLESVLDELRQVPRNFMFVDDNIIADPDYARSLFRAMVPMRKRWVSQCSIEIADDPELLELARQAGCRGLFIGVETVNRRNLESMDKGFNVSRGYRERLAAIRGKGIGIVAGMIVGLDNDDVGVFERTLRFLQECRIDAIQLNIMTPLPGTPLYDDMDRSGRIMDRDWSHYDFRCCVIRPARMTARELQDGADWLYSQFYRLDRIALRFVRWLFGFGPMQALLGLKLNLTYRRDLITQGRRGRNPARAPGRERISRLRALVGRPLGS